VFFSIRFLDEKMDNEEGRGSEDSKNLARKEMTHKAKLTTKEKERSLHASYFYTY
jgi:hypothetical protein